MYLLKIKRYFFVPLIFLAFLYSSYMLATGNSQLNFLVLGAIFETNLKEATQFLSSTFVQIGLAIKILILVAFIFYIVREKSFDRLRNKIQLKKSVLIIALIGSISIIPIVNIAGKDLSQSYPMYLYDKINDYFTSFHKFEIQYRQFKYNFSGEVDTDSSKSENYILIIGEACRKQSMSIYGYKKPTTPGLDSISKYDNGNILAFSQGISQAQFTRYAVPLILSTTSAEYWNTFMTYPTILDVFKERGYKLYLASNQPPFGFNEHLTTLLFKNKFESSFYLTVTDVPGYDADMLPQIFKFIKEKGGKKLIIIHLDGSHYKYSQKYPKKFAYFKGDDLISTYDNSIRYTDYFLKTLSDYILNSRIPSCLFYTSDHGENLNDNNDGDYLHGMKDFTKYELEVPFIFIYNNSFLKLKHDKVSELRKHLNIGISHANISHTFLGLAGLKDKNYYQKNMDLSSEFFKNSDRYLINNMEKIVEYKNVEKRLQLK